MHCASAAGSHESRLFIATWLTFRSRKEPFTICSILSGLILSATSPIASRHLWLPCHARSRLSTTTQFTERSSTGSLGLSKIAHTLHLVGNKLCCGGQREVSWCGSVVAAHCSHDRGCAWVTVTHPSTLASSSVWWTAGELSAQVGSFVRSIALARLLTAEHLGITAALALVFYFFEMVSNVAVDKFVIQARDGDEARIQGAAHFIQVLRGAVTGAGTFVLAEPLASLFGSPEAAWALRWISLAPVIGGLVHTDVYRLQRSLHFRCVGVATISSAVVSTSATVLMAWSLRTYDVLVYTLILQSGTFVIASHFCAQRPYRLSFERTPVKRIVGFGWPLIVNGLLMYGILAGDRVVIAASNRLFARAAYDLADLGAYWIVASLAMIPTTIIANWATAFFLPLLSRTRDRPLVFDAHYATLAGTLALISAIVTIVIVVAGDVVVVALYGVTYASYVSVLSTIAVAQALRVVRVAPTVTSIALGHTADPMIANAVRLGGIGLVLSVGAFGGPLILIAASSIVAELGALVVSLTRLKARRNVSVSMALMPSLIALGAIVAALLIRWSAMVPHEPAVAFGVSAVLIAGVSLAMLTYFPSLLREYRRAFRSAPPT